MSWFDYFVRLLPALAYYQPLTVARRHGWKGNGVGPFHDQQGSCRGAAAFGPQILAAVHFCESRQRRPSQSSNHPLLSDQPHIAP